MRCSTLYLVIFSLIVMLLLTVTNGKSTESFETNSTEAKTFLSDVDGEINRFKRGDDQKDSKQCVLCAAKIADCCHPNYCKKHHVRFNECVEVKGPK
ncbi:unnamed protein product [Didymodactylos carnosus]|uniref:Uncharacterized protein n=1 Tax=Didymodactylos carnosus TaxID=1234261 RepID=A0A814T4R0_9BILA|nr:unnamed protein product [Didymodactylos carnosus]CAF1557337.1 unnamed protein product [Didymodactylos carnosus]CAF3920448.1 unnamed protein product [Didymodactylos carnosus]CAF4348447.1 unnamed protein product [Didymodactylos carnosus]